LAAAAWAPLSCSFLPEREGPAEPEVPEAFSVSGGGAAAPEAWWEDFDSPELSRLVSEAFSGSFSLRQVEARLRQARAAAGIAGSELYPSLSAEVEGGATRARTGSSGERVTATTEQYSAALAASYEIDLWGRVRSTARAADADVAAASWDLDAARVSLAAALADRWLNVVELKARRTLVEEQLKSNRTYLDLLRLRQTKGLATALAVFQQEQIVAGTAALIPSLQAQLETNTHDLAVLTGRPPRSDLGLAVDSLPSLTPLPAVGLPSELLERRPDIRAALARLEAADWEVAAARANRLPALSLTGSAGFRSNEFDDLFSNWFAGFVAGLVAPLVDGGRRSAEAARSEAVSDERLSSYRETVLTALGEVENALARESRQDEYIRSLDRQLAAARNAFSEAMLRYRKGDIEYLDVLASLSSVQGLERQVLSARRDLLLYRVGLYRSLGGGWEPVPENENGEKDEK